MTMIAILQLILNRNSKNILKSKRSRRSRKNTVRNKRSTKRSNQSKAISSSKRRRGTKDSTIMMSLITLSAKKLKN